MQLGQSVTDFSGCCRSQLDKDEVDSVAALLGDLVTYRARGASHLEVVAGKCCQ